MTEEQRKQIKAFKYWLDTNTESGISTIPEYMCKNIYNVAVKALEENEQIKAQINRCFQKITDKMKTENDHDEQLLDCIERLQEENEQLKMANAELKKTIERWNEVSYEQHEAIKRAREEMQSLDEELCSRFLIEDCDKEAHRAYEQCLDILDKYIHNMYVEKEE